MVCLKGNPLDYTMTTLHFDHLEISSHFQLPFEFSFDSVSGFRIFEHMERVCTLLLFNVNLIIYPYPPIKHSF